MMNRLVTCAFLTSIAAASSSAAPQQSDYYKCELILDPSPVADLQRYVGLGPLKMSFLREDWEGRDRWIAWGHADLTVHRFADQGFPVNASTSGNRTQMTWNIHQARVAGLMTWVTKGRSNGKIRLRVDSASFHPAPYFMSGKCRREISPLNSFKAGTS